ncbi:hypothetical protein Mapa_009371 [Marchantia paleacea]|nr:hypothetical protein Mapa_009371 [Marchantia paleacea]
MLGISYGEVALIMVAAVALFGPKDIPIIARAAGRLSGKAIGYIQSARGGLNGVMQRAEVNQVHKELQETMAQLEAIRHEINSGISLVNPGPLTRRILKGDSSGSHQVNSPTQSEAEDMKRGDLHSKHTMITQKGLGLGTQIASEMQSLQHTVDSQRASGIFDALPSSTTRVAVPRIVVKPVGVQPPMAQQLGLQPRDSVQDITVLPISALSAGLLPSRTDPVRGGSDVVYEAIVERRVAFDTLEFFKQSESLPK